MKKFSYKKVPYTIERIGYGLYKVTAAYHNKVVRATCNLSYYYDDADSDNIECLRAAKRHYYRLINSQSKKTIR